MRLRNAILVAVAALLAACGGEDPAGDENTGSFGETCAAAEDCVGLAADLAPETNADQTIECAAAAGPKRCRFSCRLNGQPNAKAAEACGILGGVCDNGICMPQ